MTHRRQLGAGAALLLSLTTACGSSDTATAPGVSPPQDETTTISSGATTIEASTTVRETTPPPSTTAAPAPTTTTTVAPITTTLPPPPPPAPCGVFPAIPAGALELNTAVLDAIGDGTADDTVTSYLDPGPSEWRLRLDLPVGSSSELVVTGIGPGVLKVLGAAQVDNAGADEFLAVAGAGAATQNLGAFGADSDGCLFRFDQDGATFVAPVGATVTRQDGLSCTGGGLTLGHAEEAGGGLWEVSSTTLTRISLTELSATTSSIIGGVAPGDVGNVSTLDCPGLAL